MSNRRKASHQHVWINGKTLTVLSVSLHYPEGRLFLRTDVFGQMNDLLDTSSEYELRLISGERYRCRYLSLAKSERLEKLEFRVLREMPASDLQDKN